MNAARVAAKSLFAVSDLLMPRLPGPRILIYHQVGSHRTHEMNVESYVFRQQLDWMRAHGEIVSLDEAIHRRSEPNAHRLFVISFDDGYRDVFVNAFPIMAKEAIPFTLYLTSGPIESPDKFPGWPGEPLTWYQVQSMFNSGLVTLGAHTHTHRDLRSLDELAIAEELDRSNQIIHDRTGTIPEHFTYPKGWWSAQADNLIRVRYRTATTGNGVWRTRTTNLHRIHRIPVQRSDVGKLFTRKVISGARVEGVLRVLIRSRQVPREAAL